MACQGNIKLGDNEGKKYQARPIDCAWCRQTKKCINIKNEEVKKRRRTLYTVTQKYGENLQEKMRGKTGDPAYRELYSRRQQIIGPVFADITYCKGMNRFTLRTKKKVGIQWKLYCIVHNIGKCIEPLGLKHG